MPNLTIRRYTGSDLGAAARLWHESWRSTGLAVARLASEPAMRQRLEQELASGWSLYLAESDRANLVGLLALKLASRCLDQIFVAPATQRRGVGGVLLDFAKARMPEGVWLRTATDNTGACRFYERNGFHRGETATHPTLGHQTVIYRWP